MTRITFVATRKNLDPTERELYEMQWQNAKAVKRTARARKALPVVR